METQRFRIDSESKKNADSLSMLILKDIKSILVLKLPMVKLPESYIKCLRDARIPAREAIQYKELVIIFAAFCFLIKNKETTIPVTYIINIELIKDPVLNIFILAPNKIV
jgi:hypothetical protein